MTAPIGWVCRTCCEKAAQGYRYPNEADVYCAVCSSPLTLKEQEVTVLRLLLRAKQTGQGAQLVGEPSAAPPPQQELLSVKQVAELTGKSEKSIYAQANRGSLPGLVRVGRSLRVRRAALVGSPQEVRVSPGRTRR